MKTAIHYKSKKSGFTLVEVMIVVGLILLLAIIAIPSAQRARKRSQAANTHNDLRVIDNALAQWATENQKDGTAVATFDEIRPYLKAGSKAQVSGKDTLGHDFGP